MSDFFSNLNPEIKRIIENTETPSRIIAAPGSGKTETIAWKYLYLVLEKKIDFSDILVLTFSNKATLELKNRIMSKLEKSKVPFYSENIRVSTIHGFCKEVIDHNKPILMNDFSATNVLSEISQAAFILSFIENFGFRSKTEATKKVLDEFIPFFNLVADENLSEFNIYDYLKELFEQLLESYHSDTDNIDYYKKEFKDISNLIYYNSLYPIYRGKLIERKYIDFSHMQKFVLEELESNVVLLDKLRNENSYILIDEFQDTSYLQSEIILKIAHPLFKLTICGDDDQSLYRFRGASVNNFLDFKRRIPLKVDDYFLETNFRSKSNIVYKSFELIKNNNPYRIEQKNIRPNVEESGIIRIIESNNLSSEARDICDLISRLKSEKKIKSYSDIAILFRSVKNDSFSLLNQLKKEKIPFRVFGIDKVETSNILYSFLECWKFACSYSETLDLLNNYFIRIDESEIKMIEENSFDLEFIKALIKESKNKDEIRYLLSLFEIKKALKEKDISSNISFFYTLLNSNKHFFNSLENDEYFVLSELGYLSKVVLEFDLAYQRTDPYLFSKFFESMSLSGEEEFIKKSESGAVQIMTIHQSKGLEFPVVIMPNCINKGKFKNKFEKLFPLFHYESINSQLLDELDERKLFYVGLTRAEDFLFITYPQKKPWGTRERNAKPLSYIKELKLKASSYDEVKNEISNYEEIRKHKDLDYSERLVLNFSKIHTYIDCPRKYNLKYNLNLSTVLESQMYFGSSLHSCLEEIHKNYLKSNKTQYTKSELEGIIDNNWIDITYRKRETKKLKETALLYLYNYINTYSHYFKDIKFAEREFNIVDEILNFEINGIMDLVLINEKDEINIVDFKVNKIDHPVYEKQMQLYSFCYNHAFKSKPSNLRLHSLKQNTHTDVVFNKSEQAKFVSFLTDLVSEIRQENFQPNKGNHCKLCQYQSLCYPQS